MIIIPAIDIKAGKVVRLSQGKFHEVTIYSERPTLVAKEWEAAGATLLHVVDLDGAEKGKIENLDIIAGIAKTVNIPIQMGGGIRTKEDIKKVLASGVRRVVLGTKVIEDKEFLKEILSQWGEKILVSLDCSRGIVAKQGWTSVSTLKAEDFAKELASLGLKTLVYTDIARDGTLRGPNIDGIKNILDAVAISVIASGGISELSDIKKLVDLNAAHLAGVIVGKALYEHRFSLQDAIKLCSQKE